MRNPKNILLVVFLLLAGLLRLVGLFDPPLFFNPTRQLRSAIIARGMFYESLPESDARLREKALETWRKMEQLEPPILERVSASLFHLTGESIAVPRVINTVLWLVASLQLYIWASRMAGASGGAAALAYFLFLPFSVYASRSFQPDPGMVVWLVLSGYALYRWRQSNSWAWALWAGLSGGLAILTKPMAVFFVAGMAVGALFWKLREDLSGVMKDQQVYVVAGLMLLPTALFAAFGAGGSFAGNITTWTAISRWRDVLSPSFYMRWLIRVDGLLILPLVLTSLTGALTAKNNHRPIIWGLWLGYAVYGVFFPHHIVTHDYYHLPLVFITAISLASIGQMLLERISGEKRLVRVAFAAVVLLGLLYPAWIARSVLASQDFSDAHSYWELVGQEIPDGSRVIGYSQDYGFRLMYYGWQPIQVLPERLSVEDFQARYAEADYFVITAKNQLSPELADFLETTFPVHAQGGGYTVYDLQP